ncbi:MAG: SIS domain-containing protein [Armatimonadetes bacterium]|nr:SIS domain-containing protein [Armatimonadota bacterium]
MERIRWYLFEVSRLAAGLPAAQLEGIVARLLRLYDAGGQLLLLGNGGSAATASHLVADFQKILYIEGGKPFRVLACTDNVPLITAWANDTHYETVFAEQVRAFARPGDVVIAFSGSGNSPNVLAAVARARAQGAYTIGFTGRTGGKLEAAVDECVVVPCDNMQRIEDCHMIMGHVVFWRMAERLRERSAAPAPAVAGVNR